MRKTCLFIIVLFLPVLGMAQYHDTPPRHGNEYGMDLTIAMSGFGIGGTYRIALPNMYHLGLNADFYMMRDENEITYYDYYGYPIERNKFNRLFFLPVNAELKKRLFAESIEESFRPYLVGQAGLTFGMNFPQTDSYDYQRLTPEERSKLPKNNEYQFTMNFALGAGVDISTSQDFFVSVRPQVRFIYFPDAIAGKKNHTTFEIRIELGKRLLND